MAALNLPNRITLSRLVLSVMLFGILASMQEGWLLVRGPWAWAAFTLFVVAAGTDWLDGWVARRYGMVTAFGRIMDPFVDKVVVCGTFIFLCSLTSEPLVAPWLVVVIVAREFFVSAIRGFMESRGVEFGADMSGKIKMVLQCCAIGAILCRYALEDPITLAAPEGLAWFLTFCTVITKPLLWGTLLATLWSAGHYASKARANLTSAPS